MQNVPFLIKYKLHHLICWLILFGLWYFLRYEDFATEAIAFKVTLIKVIDLAMMVYLTNYVLIPKLLYKRKYGQFVLVLVLMIIISSVAKMNILGHIMNRPGLLFLSGDLKGRIYDNVIPHFLLVLSGAAFKLMMDYRGMQQRMVEMAREKAEAELNFLKSQINPHFLFNSINSVYFLIEKNNTAAREALHKFSGMLRYQLYEMNGDRIPVEKEINYLKDYVDLQKLRKDENYAVTFDCAANVKSFFIEPLLLVPFVENAFKHISHHQKEPNFIQLDLSMHNGSFHFKITNSKEVMQIEKNSHSGIGLNNVKRRLELLYPEKHLLQIKDTDNIFSVLLQLKIIN